MSVLRYPLCRHRGWLQSSTRSASAALTIRVSAPQQSTFRWTSSAPHLHARRIAPTTLSRCPWSPLIAPAAASLRPVQLYATTAPQPSDAKYPPLATTSPATSSTSSPPSVNPPVPSASSSSSAVPASVPAVASAVSAELNKLPPPPPPSQTASWLARPFITAMRAYPLHLLVSLTAFEFLSFSITHQALLYFGIRFSSTFAYAYIISVPVRRSALPKLILGVPLGVVVATIMPWFKEIRITELTRNPALQRAWNDIKGMFTSRASVSTPLSTPVAASAFTSVDTATAAPVDPSSTATAEAQTKRKWWNPIRWTAYLARQADRYGLALLVGYRMAGAGIILALYYLLEWGVPIRQLEHYAAWFGYPADSKAVGKAVDYAGAVVCSAVLFPATLMLAPFLARFLHAITSRLFRGRKRIARSRARSSQSGAVGSSQ